MQKPPYWHSRGLFCQAYKTTRYGSFQAASSITVTSFMSNIAFNSFLISVHKDLRLCEVEKRRGLLRSACDSVEMARIPAAVVTYI